MDVGAPGEGNFAADLPGDVVQQVILDVVLVAKLAGNAAIEGLDEHGPLAAGDASGGRGDSLDDVGSAALGPFGPQVVAADAAGSADFLVDVPTAFGMLRVVDEFFILEVVAGLADAGPHAGDNQPPLLLGRQVLPPLGVGGRGLSDF